MFTHYVIKNGHMDLAINAPSPCVEDVGGGLGQIGRYYEPPTFHLRITDSEGGQYELLGNMLPPPYSKPLLPSTEPTINLAEVREEAPSLTLILSNAVRHGYEMIGRIAALERENEKLRQRLAEATLADEPIITQTEELP